MWVKSMLMPPKGAAKFPSKLVPPENGTVEITINGYLHSWLPGRGLHTHWHTIFVAYLHNFGYFVCRPRICDCDGQPIRIYCRPLRIPLGYQVLIIGADRIIANFFSYPVNCLHGRRCSLAALHPTPRKNVQHSCPSDCR